MKKTTKPQNQQTTLWKAHLFSISQAGMVPEELALLKSYSIFLYPTGQLFKEKYNPVDRQCQVFSSRSKAMTADISNFLQHMHFPLPMLAPYHRIWVSAPWFVLWLSPLPLQIKQPCGGLGNYFLMQSATIAERVFVDPWLISFHCEIYACVKSGGRVLAMFRVHWNASKGQEHFSYVSHVTADGKRESRLSWCVVADLRFPSLMAEGDVGQCKRSPTPVGSSSLGILVGLAVLTFINKSRAVYIDVPFRSWCSSWLHLCFWRMCFLSAEAA